MQQLLSERRHDATTSLVLNRPDKLNALSGALTEELLAAVERAASDGTRLLVFSGAGKGFSGGFDFSDLETQSDGELVHRFIRLEMLLQAVCHAPMATLALAHGACYGAAADLVCACQQRIAAPGTRFRMPGLAFGVVLGTQRLFRAIGATAARDILGKLRAFDAEEALRIGFVTGLRSQDEWPAVMAEAESAAGRLDAGARAMLLQRTTVDSRDADLAALARSVAAPGLKQRILSYLREIDRRPGAEPGKPERAT